MARQPEPLTFLRRLTLTHTDLSDATLLGAFKGLVEVDVSRTQVASLEWVALLPRLEAVKLKGAAVNRATLDAAKKQFPRLRLG